MSPVHGIFWLESLLVFETMYTFRIPLYLFLLCSLLLFFFFIPPHAIISVDVGDVTRDLLDTYIGLDMVGTLSIWRLANNVLLHNYHIHTYIHTYIYKIFWKSIQYHLNHMMLCNPDQSPRALSFGDVKLKGFRVYEV